MKKLWIVVLILVLGVSAVTAQEELHLECDLASLGELFISVGESLESGALTAEQAFQLIDVLQATLVHTETVCIDESPPDDTFNYSDIPQSRTSDGAFVLGDPDAPVTIIEFADFACPHCQSYSVIIRQLINEYVVTGKAKLEYRMFISGADPIFGPYVAQLAECAETLRPGSFWQAHDVLFELGSRGRFNSTTGSTFAERMALPYSSLLSCAESASQYVTDARLGSSLNVQSTPTIMYRIGDTPPQFVNMGGRVWDRGPVPLELLGDLIEAAQLQ